jgi:hypothetical protein
MTGMARGDDDAYIVVEATAPESPDVRQFRTYSCFDSCLDCCLGARQPDPAHASLCATDAACGIGRRRQYANQRDTVRSRQSEGALRSQRLRKRRTYPATAHQYPAATGLLRVRQFGTAVAPSRHTVLCGRIATGHRRARDRAKASCTGSPARSRTGQHVHRDLPGLLSRLLDDVEFNLCGSALNHAERVGCGM